MDDLEITRLCARAAGWTFFHSKHGYWTLTDPDGNRRTCCEGWNKFDYETGEKLPEPTECDALAECSYFPLDDRGQALELVERLRLDIAACNDGDWFVCLMKPRHEARDANLLRAICLCAARVQQARETKE